MDGDFAFAEREGHGGDARGGVAADGDLRALRVGYDAYAALLEGTGYLHDRESSGNGLAGDGHLDIHLTVSERRVGIGLGHDGQGIALAGELAPVGTALDLPFPGAALAGEHRHGVRLCQVCEIDERLGEHQAFALFLSGGLFVELLQALLVVRAYLLRESLVLSVKLENTVVLGLGCRKVSLEEIQAGGVLHGFERLLLTGGLCNGCTAGYGHGDHDQ